MVSTEQTVTVREFATLIFTKAGFQNLSWQGEGVNEKLIDSTNGQVLLDVDP